MIIYLNNFKKTKMNYQYKITKKDETIDNDGNPEYHLTNILKENGLPNILYNLHRIDMKKASHENNVLTCEKNRLTYVCGPNGEKILPKRLLVFDCNYNQVTRLYGSNNKEILSHYNTICDGNTLNLFEDNQITSASKSNCEFIKSNTLVLKNNPRQIESIGVSLWKIYKCLIIIKYSIQFSLKIKQKIKYNCYFYPWNINIIS